MPLMSIKKGGGGGAGGGGGREAEKSCYMEAGSQKEHTTARLILNPHKPLGGPGRLVPPGMCT